MRLYRALLFLYPKAFRVEYGEEMCHVFFARRRDASGVVETVALWLDVVSDTVANALRVHWDVLRQDLRYTVRSLARAPGFAATALIVTALGIGANTAVFSILDRVLIRPLPFADSDRLVKLWENVPRYSRLEVSPPNYRDWAEMSTRFERMAAFNHWHVNLIGHGEPLRLRGAAVEPDVFTILGVEPVMGRFLGAADAREDAPDALVLGFGLWQRAFGGRGDVLGTTVRLDGRPFTVVGVMPEHFHFPDRNVEMWGTKRFTSDDFEDRDNNYLQVLAKLGAGVSLEEARAEMDVITERLERAHPGTNADTRATVISLRDEVPWQSRMLLGALFAASGCLLLIACSNLANLLLARGMARRKELTVRTALGGGRERLVRQLLTESLLLSIAGGALGVVIAAASVPLLSRLVPTRLPIGDARAFDVRVLAFAAVLTLGTALAFGMLPALRSSRTLDMSALREGSKTGMGDGREGLRSVLVVAQVSVTVVLLVASGLLIRALWQVQAVDPGFRTESVLAVETPLPIPKYDETAKRAALYSRVLEEVRSLPGVSAASYTSFLPMEMSGGIWSVHVPGVEATENEETASLRFVTPGFFATLGIPVRLGRDVSDADTLETPSVAVVSESFARRYWPDRDPLGQRFDFGLRERLVVGVVGDIRVRGLERESEPQVYLPHRQVPDGSLIFYRPKELVIRSAIPPESLMAGVRESVHRADPEIPIASVRSLDEVVSADTAPRTTQIRVLGAFAGLSLLLSGVGIYGLLSFAVSRRRSEIGVRIALGARGSDVLAMFLREGAVLAGVGVVLGGLLAYVAGQALETLLVGVAPSDAATYGTAAGVVLLTAILGSLLPALQAARVDPTRTIRAE